MYKWQAIGSSMAMETPYFSVRVDKCQLEDGATIDYFVWQSILLFLVLAITSEGRAILVKQYRHPVGQVSLELPGGGPIEGETIQEAAMRELQEETGFQCHRLIEVGRFYTDCARSTQEVVVLVGTNAERIDKPDNSSQETTEVVLIEREHLFERLLADVTDGQTLGAVLLGLRALG